MKIVKRDVATYCPDCGYKVRSVYGFEGCSTNTMRCADCTLSDMVGTYEITELI